MKMTKFDFDATTEKIYSDWFIHLMNDGATFEDLDALLAFIGKNIDCDRVSVFEIKDTGLVSLYNNTYEWCRDDVLSQIEILQNEPVESIEWWRKHFKRSGLIFLEDVEILKKTRPQTYSLLKMQGIKSIIVIPINKKDKNIGFYCIENPRNIDPSDHYPLLILFSKIIGHIIKTKNLQKSLHRIKTHDHLTEAYNRYSFNKEINSPHDAKSYGIIFADLSELKYINKNLGYTEGDRVVKDTYLFLQDLFQSYPVYRISGEKFIVLCKNINEKVFSVKIEDLLKKRGSLSTHLSLGYTFTNVLPIDLNKIVLTAEQAMYSDKQNYIARLEGSTDSNKKSKNISQLSIADDADRNLKCFLKNNYFDLTTLVNSFAKEDCYVYFGDLRTNVFYVSDSFKDTFGLPSNIVKDLLTTWEKVILNSEDLLFYKEDIADMLLKKRVIHDVRYRVKDKKGEEFWIHCYGHMKWNEKKDTPLFFSGSASKLEYEFIVDPITDFLCEHGAVTKIIEMQHQKIPLAAIGFRLHHFREINELHGRQTANNLLKDISENLAKRFLDKLLFYRMDGLRFIAIVAQEMSASLKETTLEIKKIIEDTYRNYAIHIRKSASLVIIPPLEKYVVPNDILGEILNLLEMAKDTPDKDYIVHSEENIELRKTRSRMLLALNRDVNQNFANFRLVIQPSISTRVGYPIISGEGLLRWKFEEKDVSPGIFIPLLERSQQIIPVGKWVFEQSVKNVKMLLTHVPDFHLNFNVSYPQILDNDFLPFMERTLERFHVDGKHLVMEITETHYNENPKKLREFILGCKKLGMLVAIDDFGTGYSSLELLMKYPSDIVKLDRSLIKDIGSFPENVDFITSIVFACHKFKKIVCVEGVETEEELNAVIESGADMVQGFYFYRPTEISDVYSLVQHEASMRKIRGAENVFFN